jgi:hypothetical protein
VIVKEGDLVIDRGDTYISVDVPAGEARDARQEYLPLSREVKQKLFKGGKRAAGLTIDFRVTRVRGAD